MSHVGSAIRDVLVDRHRAHHQSLWNVSCGKVVGSVQQTPVMVWDQAEDPPENNDDWFPKKIYDLICRTEAWCDIMSLGPPDGKFLKAFADALRVVADRSRDNEKSKPIVVRMMFGNIMGCHIDCARVMNKLTAGLPADANLHVWVGAWRKGFSWNHAKLIAVDGYYLSTGGHNLWEKHYLRTNPVHDLSVELEGQVGHDGHFFANEQWKYVEKKSKTWTGVLTKFLPNRLPSVFQTRVDVSAYPPGNENGGDSQSQSGTVATKYPPQYTKKRVFYTSASVLWRRANSLKDSSIPLITVGRQGRITRKSRPSDDAIIAMFDSSKEVIRLVIQDIGPVCIPQTKLALPGLTWPKEYLDAFARAIYKRNVCVEIVLSNPCSVPNKLNLEANYGNGWDCIDVAAEIVKAIKRRFQKADDESLRKAVRNNLRLCFTRHRRKATYEDGNTIGMHSKHFIVDNVCCYIGSQNLYKCDLAEWGVFVDHAGEVGNIIADYWDPVWKNSFTGEDVDVDKVMDGLKINRDGKHKLLGNLSSPEAARRQSVFNFNSEYYDSENETAA